MRLPRGLPKLRSLNQIEQTDILGYIKNGSCPAFLAKYSPLYAFPNTISLKLAQDYHPCHLPTVEHYRTRSDPLWSFLVLNKQVSGKKGIVRSWLHRRTRSALTQALKDSGYDKDGSKLPNTPSWKPELKGTLTFIIHAGIFEVNYKTLLSRTKGVVHTVVEWCSGAQGKSKNSYEVPGQKGSMKKGLKQTYGKSEDRDRRGKIWSKQNPTKTAQFGNYKATTRRQNSYQEQQYDRPR